MTILINEMNPVVSLNIFKSIRSRSNKDEICYYLATSENKGGGDYKFV